MLTSEASTLQTLIHPDIKLTSDEPTTFSCVQTLILILVIMLVFQNIIFPGRDRTPSSITNDNKIK
jgi:hypothetical protein